jgi:hypothetical protein
MPPIPIIKIEDVKEYLKIKIKKSLQEDKVFEKQVEITKYTKSLNQHLSGYFTNIFEHHKKLKHRFDGTIKSYYLLYFLSDLPLSVLKILENAEMVQKDYIDIYDKKVQSEKVKLIGFLNNRVKFQRICDEHNGWMKPFNERLDRIESLTVKIVWYIDFCNCNSVEEILKRKEILSSKIDASALKEMLSELDTLNKEIENLIRPKLEFKAMINTDDSTSNALLKIFSLLDTPEVTKG